RMPALEQVTGLKFKRDPAVAPRNRNQVRDYIVHKFNEDLPPAELAGLQATLRLFGFVPDSLDLRESFADVLTEQIGGYFDPDSNTLYVPTDIDSFIVRTSVTHELVHALQGQYVNLDSLLELKHANDRRGAAQAVLEGQATLVQTLVMMPEQRLEELPSFWEARLATMAQQRRMPAFAHAPRWLGRRPLSDSGTGVRGAGMVFGLGQLRRGGTICQGTGAGLGPEAVGPSGGQTMGNHATHDRRSTAGPAGRRTRWMGGMEQR